MLRDRQVAELHGPVGRLVTILVRPRNLRPTRQQVLENRDEARACGTMRQRGIQQHVFLRRVLDTETVGDAVQGHLPKSRVTFPADSKGDFVKVARGMVEALRY